MAHPQSVIPNASTPVALSFSQPELVREAIEPMGEGPFVEAVREWIENIALSPRRAPLHLVR